MENSRDEEDEEVMASSGGERPAAGRWDDSGLLVQARSLIAHGSDEEALLLLDRAIVSTAMSVAEVVEARLLRAGILIRLKRPGEALVDARAATRLAPEEARASVCQTEALRDLGRNEEGLQASARALELDPDNGSAWRLQGRLLGELHRYLEALAAYDHALATLPPGALERADVYAGQAWALLDRGQLKLALASAHAALAADPNAEYAWLAAASALDRLRRPSEALEAVEQQLERTPNVAHAWDERGVALLALGREEEALQAIKHALELDPAFATALRHRAQVAHRLERMGTLPAELLPILETGLPVLEHPYFWLDEAYQLHLLGRDAEALAAIARSLELDPQGLYAQDALKLRARIGFRHWWLRSAVRAVVEAGRLGKPAPDPRPGEFTQK